MKKLIIIPISLILIIAFVIFFLPKEEEAVEVEENQETIKINFSGEFTAQELEKIMGGELTIKELREITGAEEDCSK